MLGKSHGPRVAIKREREESVERKTLKAARAWSIELKASKSVIDLDPDDDASPKQRVLGTGSGEGHGRRMP